MLDEARRSAGGKAGASFPHLSSKVSLAAASPASHQLSYAGTWWALYASILVAAPHGLCPSAAAVLSSDPHGLQPSGEHRVVPRSLPLAWQSGMVGALHQHFAAAPHGLRPSPAAVPRGDPH